MKFCNTCQIEKPFTAFYKQKGRKFMSNCKNCRRVIQRESDKKNKITMQRIWYHWTIKAVLSPILRERKLARYATRNAVRRGEIQKALTCDFPLCSKTTVEAHHYDYSKPTEIKWLCSKHHKIADLVMRASYKYKLILQ